MREHGGMLRLDSLLTHAARSQPDRDAVIFGGDAWTYAQVCRRAQKFAGALASLGVGKGERIAYWSGNRPEFVEFLFGASMLGAIAAPLDQWWTRSDARVAIGQLRPKVLIVGATQAGLVPSDPDALKAVGVERVLCLDEDTATARLEPYARHLNSADEFSSAIDVDPNDPAVILFTSGSTGRSKGAVHTHASLTAAARIMCRELGLRDGERTLHFLPLFSSCLEHLIPLTLVRATHVILPQFNAHAVWDSIRDYRVTHFDAVPTTLRRLVDAMPAEVPESLRLISYASEPMPAQLIKTLIERLPNVDFVQFYGMIEQLCLTVLSAEDQLRKIGTVGRPMMEARLSLNSAEEGQQTAQGTGEILARSPTMFAGYWRDEAATAQVMQGSWMRTGDLGSFDADGYLRLEGRTKEIIKTGGLTVIPSEVEGALLGHPNVREAAVVGIPDDVWGEAVHAFVTLSPGAVVEESELRSFCQERLSGYKRPKAIHIVPELPRTGIGKIARRQVRDNALAQGAR